MEVSFGIYPEDNDEEKVKEGDEEEVLKTVEEELKRLRNEKNMRKHKKKGSNKRKRRITEFVSTGVKQLDKILKGGYPLGSVITINGDVGSGKSTLGMQFLMEGIKNDENVMYISFEEHKTASLKHMKGLGWDISELEKQGRLLFVEFPVDEIEQLIIKNDVVHKMILQSNITRVLIDPITILGLLYDNELDRRRSLIKFIERARGWNTTTLFIAEDNGKWQDYRVPRSISGIESLTDGYIYLGYERANDKRKREHYIEIIKMRGIDYDNTIQSFTIGNEGIKMKGITKKNRR